LKVVDLARFGLHRTKILLLIDNPANCSSGKTSSTLLTERMEKNQVASAAKFQLFFHLTEENLFSSQEKLFSPYIEAKSEKK
jgi:hypothetical protein